MDYTILKGVITPKDLRVVIICLVSGKVLQVLCRQYVDNHPEEFEFLKSKPEAEDIQKPKNRKFRRLRHFFPRGGAIIPASLLKTIMYHLYKAGVKEALILSVSGFVGSKVTSYVGSKVSISGPAIAAYLNGALQQNLPHLERKRCIWVKGKKVYIDCAEGLEMLFLMLDEPTLPFEKKEELTQSILKKYLDLRTADNRVKFVLCIVAILLAFSSLSMANYYLVINSLIQAIREGKIPKIVGRAIIRKLRKQGLPIHPELVEVVDS